MAVSYSARKPRAKGRELGGYSWRRLSPKTAFRWLTQRPVLATFVLALIARALLAIIIQTEWGTSFFAVNDDKTYSWMAAEVARGADTSGWDPYMRFLFNATATLTFPLAVLYRIFGFSDLIGPLLSAFYGATAAAATAWTATRFMDGRWALLAGLFVAFLPSQILWSSMTLKDSATWAMLAITAGLVAGAYRASARHLLLIAPLTATSLLLLAHLRVHSFIIACWAVCIAAAFVRGEHRRLVVGTGLALAIVLPLAIGLGPAGIDFVRNQQNLIEARRFANAVGAATALMPVDEGAQREAVELRVAIANAEIHSQEARQRAQALRELATQLRNRAEELEAQANREDQSTSGSSEGTGTTGSSEGTGTTGSSEGTGTTPEAEQLLQEAAEAEREAENEISRVETLESSREENLIALRGVLGEARAPEADTALEANLLHLPRGVSVMLLEPYPWDAYDNSRVRMASLETILWYPLLGLAVIGLGASISERLRPVVFAVLASGGVMLAYALTEGNFGTAYRHRGEFVWGVALLAAIGSRWLWQRYGQAKPEAATARPAMTSIESTGA